MNILRELRRTSKKSIETRIRLILLFSVLLIINTYAWWYMNKEVDLGGLEADVRTLDASTTYVINEENALDATTNFAVDEVYPGMPDYEDYVHIYNLGESSTKITLEIESIKIFGQDILGELEDNGEIQKNGNTVTLFVNDTKYPFCISYSYDKDVLEEKYEYGKLTDGVFEDLKNDEGKYGYETDNSSVATISFNINWEYDGGSDELDTEMGKKAYEYYKNAKDNGDKAIEITMKIISEAL